MSCSLAHNEIGFQSPSLKVSWKTFIFTVSCHYFDASAQHNSESSRSYLVMLQAANLWTIVNYMEKWLYLKHFIFFLLVVKFSSCAEVDAVYAGWREGRRQECGGSTCSHPPELAIRYPLPPTPHPPSSDPIRLTASVKPLKSVHIGHCLNLSRASASIPSSSCKYCRCWLSSPWWWQVTKSWCYLHWHTILLQR